MIGVLWAYNIYMQVTMYILATKHIYIYIFIEPFLSVRKLLPQRSYDRRETRDYYGTPHGACRKGVDGRRDAAPEESAARFPYWTDKDAMFFVGLRMANTRFRIIVTLQKARIRRSRYLASSTADVAAKTRGGKEDQKQRAVHSVHIGLLFPTVWKFSTMQWY